MFSCAVCILYIFLIGTISTSRVVARIKEDENLFLRLTHLLRYEQMVYEHGVEIHNRQIVALVRYRV